MDFILITTIIMAILIMGMVALIIIMAIMVTGTKPIITMEMAIMELSKQQNPIIMAMQHRNTMLLLSLVNNYKRRVICLHLFNPTLEVISHHYWNSKTKQMLTFKLKFPLKTPDPILQLKIKIKVI